MCCVIKLLQNIVIRRGQTINTPTPLLYVASVARRRLRLCVPVVLQREVACRDAQRQGKSSGGSPVNNGSFGIQLIKENTPHQLRRAPRPAPMTSTGEIIRAECRGESAVWQAPLPPVLRAKHLCGPSSFWRFPPLTMQSLHIGGRGRGRVGVRCRFIWQFHSVYT